MPWEPLGTFKVLKEDENHHSFPFVLRGISLPFFSQLPIPPLPAAAFSTVGGEKAPEPAR